MADAEDIQPLVCDNGTGMVKDQFRDYMFLEAARRDLRVIIENKQPCSSTCNIRIQKREIFQDLALLLWHSLVQLLRYSRVCNALALLQCVASHPETRILFLNAHIPLYLYQFLNTTSKIRPFEYLRLTSLGVIGALVKAVSKGTFPLPVSLRNIGLLCCSVQFVK